MFAIWGLLLLAGIFITVRFTGLMDHMLPAGDPPNITFGRDADLPTTSNFFLTCPADRLPETDRAMQSPSFNTSVATLTEVLIDTARDHGMALKNDVPGGEAGRLYFLARTPVFRFPDWVEIELILPETGDNVTFCMLAKSVYGVEDLGQNEKRTRAWLADVVTRMGQNQ
ncbi:DUF1499 domain-containing protein [Thalassospira sp. HF15]|uniref:DUF1499 domain-containing protein n=1 Tax=Thalassospira sp. HF15 TaxID=2722755 RepID=UPI0014309A06|nr:DUF1499 domain-containing protein [Thalassospira sp. HF15]NIY76120.1 DUF1499 domain-containing protein [Thalassospira sp. HF15]